MRVERLPFTVYDIIGYLIPGAAFLLFASFHFQSSLLKLDLADVASPVAALTIFFVTAILVSYLLGHILSLIASETLEKLTLGFVGYPSEYLLREREYSIVKSVGDAERLIETHMAICRNITNKEKALYFRFVCYLPFFILSIFFELLILFRLLPRLVKALESSASEIFDLKFKSVFGFERREAANSRDWFALVEYYVFHHSGASASRMYNYVTIYGFCRNMSLVLYLGGLLLAVHFFWMNGEIRFLAWATVSWISSFVLLLAFLKYFRRYSYEAIMNFLVMDVAELKKHKS